MEVPPDVNQLAGDPQMEAMRMIQQQSQQGQQGPSSGPGLSMMPPEGMMMAQQAGPGMPPYFVAPPHMQHPSQFLPQQSMNQPGHGSSAKARLQCHACSKLLEYDAGAQYVQCFSCSTMNSVQQKTQIGGRVLSMLCAMCNTTNLAPYGINYVRCGTCHTISQVSHAYRVELQSQAGPAPGGMGGSQRFSYGGPDQMQQMQQMQQAAMMQQQMGGPHQGSSGGSNMEKSAASHQDAPTAAPIEPLNEVKQQSDINGYGGGQQ